MWMPLLSQRGKQPPHPGRVETAPPCSVFSGGDAQKLSDCWDSLGLPGIPTLSGLVSHCLSTRIPVLSAMTVSQSTVSLMSYHFTSARGSVMLASSQLSSTLAACRSSPHDVTCVAIAYTDCVSL